VQQARRVCCGDHLCARIENVSDLVGEHGRGDGGILQREYATEPAALVGSWKFNKIDSTHGSEQLQRALTQLQDSQ
jgi:hypothetical protein